MGIGGNRTRTSGFTLMELLVVVLIIGILMAILIPALSAARKYAQNVSTTAQLQGLSSAIDMYYQTFSNNYPGPLPATAIGTSMSTTSGTANKKLSGTQNLLIGLCYPVYAEPFYGTALATSPSDSTLSAPVPQSGVEPNGMTPPQPAFYPTSSWVMIAGSNTTAAPYKGVQAYVHPMDRTGPIDLSVNPMTSSPAFYSPTGKELSVQLSSGAWNNGGVANISGTINTFKFPTIVDRYPEAMPILYYRRMAGVDGTATTDGNSPPIAFTANTIVQNAPGGSFSFNDNNEYTGATSPGLQSSQGNKYPQGKLNADLLAAYDTSAQASTISGLTTSTTYNARGGYILMSAGYDHIYGVNPVTGKSDDIVVIGGTR